MSNINIKTLRKALREEFGTRQYRITSDGEIHVYGQMPNSIETGWWLYGHIDHLTRGQLSELDLAD